MITSMTLGIPEHLNQKPDNHVRLVIQDFMNTTAETLRVVKIPLSQVFEFSSRILRKWQKWIRKAIRWTGKFFKLSFLAATLLLAQKIGPAHGVSVQQMPLFAGAITSALSSSFKTELGTATHNFTITTGDTFKCALFVSAATLGASTTAYSSTNELTGTGYSAGGVTVTSSTPVLSGTTALFDFTDAAWTTATWSTANGCQVYNSSKSNKSVLAIAFGSDQSVTAGTFTIQWPAADASNAIIRF